MRTRLLIAIAAAVGAIGCGKKGEDAEARTAVGAPKEPVVCHVGGTMRDVMLEVCKRYEADTGEVVEVNSSGSGELLAHIEGQKNGDVYVCHDPFVDLLFQDFAMGVDGWVVAELTPVIIVEKGNPKNIKTIADLARPDVDLALTDYTHSTLGRMLETIFTRGGVDWERLNKDKVININRSGNYVANVVKMGAADAALVWNVVAIQRLKTLESIEIPSDLLPTPGVDKIKYEGSEETFLAPVRVTLATLQCAAQPEAALAFAEYVASEKGATVFDEFGFTAFPAQQIYKDGVAVKTESE